MANAPSAKKTCMTRANAGRVAQHEGAQFEKYIENLPCPPGVWLHRTPGRTKAVRGAGGRWVLVPDSEGKGLPDFHGGLHGRPLAFDAKRCETGAWSCASLTTEQREHLWRVAEAGDCAGIWLRFCEGADVVGDVWIDIRLVPEKGTLTLAQAQEYGTLILLGEFWRMAEAGF